jgi:hypothetical protein
MPVNVSVVVRENPSTSAVGLVDDELPIVLRQHTLSAARYLSNEFGHTLLQDRFGDIWTQKTDDVVIPIGGKLLRLKDGNLEVDLDWLQVILSKVRRISRRSIGTNVPYALNILAVYEGCRPSQLPRHMIPSHLQGNLEPMHGWKAFLGKCLPTQQSASMLTVSRSMVPRWTEDQKPRHEPSRCLASCQDLLQNLTGQPLSEHRAHVYAGSQQLHGGG